MKLKLIAIVLIAAVAAVLTFIFILIRPFQKEQPEGFLEEILVKPWIEVSKPSAAEIEKNTEAEIRRLQTGDELEREAAVKTDKSGFASIYFPTGSVARLDSDTKLLLEEEFEPENEKLAVRLFLSGGRVWSKVFELATPDSLWEVKTGNTVAAVRGTAFGAEYLDGKTRIIGSENEVVVSVIDPKTKKIIEEREVVIPAGKFIEIKDEEIEEIRRDKEALLRAVKDAPKEMLEEEWIKRAKSADLELEKKIEGLKEKGLESNKLQGELRTIQILKSEQLEKESVEPELKPAEEKPAEEKTEKILPETIKTPAPEAVGTAGAVLAKPEKLILLTADDLSRLKEGDAVYFKALLVMTNGEKKDVTETAKWQVLGGIGKMEKPGVFRAKLDISIAELGQGVGTVVAVWKDEKGEINLMAKSPVLNIKANPEEVLDLRG